MTEAGFPLPSAARVARAACTADGTRADGTGWKVESIPPVPSVSSGRPDFSGGDGISSSNTSNSINGSSISSSDVPALKGRDAGALKPMDGPPELQRGRSRNQSQ
ncbi:unnamed protein product [Pylaiella littoralis]